MPAAQDRYYSRDEVLAFPDDGNRYELVYGELLVSPAPAARHQRVALHLICALNAYLVRHPECGDVLMSPADISWGRPHDVIAQPDVFVVAERFTDDEQWSDLRRFHLFAEVLSPSTAHNDRFPKRRLYQDMGVPLYWIIDAERRRVEVWTREATEPVYEASRLEWRPTGVEEPFTLDLEELFAP